MSDGNADESHDGGDEHLAQSAVSPEMAKALLAAMDENGDEAEVIRLARELGLVGPDEDVNFDRARELIAERQAQQAAEARVVIGAGEVDEVQQQSDRLDKDGRTLVDSLYLPNEVMPQLRPHDPRDQQLIEDTLNWYADLFASPDLTAEEALNLLEDARSQGLYARDNDSGERTPIQVSDADLRDRVAQLFGEGSENQGEAERRYRELRETERSQQGQGARRGDSADERLQELNELRERIDRLENRINDLNDSGQGSRADWREVLNEFIDGGLYLYGDKGLGPRNIPQELRERVEALFEKAYQQYMKARRSEAADGQQAPQLVQDGHRGERSDERQEELQNLQDQLGELENLISDLKRSDQGSPDDWRAILDEFIVRGLYFQGDEGPRPRNIPRELRQRAEALFEDARHQYMVANQSGAADGQVPPPGRKARSRADRDREREARENVRAANAAAAAYDLDDFDREGRAGEVERDELRDPDGLMREAARPALGSLQRSINKLWNTMNRKSVSREAETHEEGVSAQNLGEYDSDLEPVMAEAYQRDPVASAVEKERRRWQSMIDREQDEGAREQLRGEQRDNMNIVRDRERGLIDRDRQERLAQLMSSGSLPAVIRQLQRYIDQEPDEDARERLRAQQRDIMQIEEDRVRALRQPRVDRN